MNRFEVETALEKPVKAAQGLFGYTTFDAVQFFDTIQFTKRDSQLTAIPLMRYRIYQYVIAINHFKDELYLCENLMNGFESEVQVVESLIKSKDVPVYPFQTKGNESSNMTDKEYMQMVEKGIASCFRGDVFQIVLSRKVSTAFHGR